MSASRRADIATKAIEKFLSDDGKNASLAFPSGIAPHLVLAFRFNPNDKIDQGLSPWFFYGALASSSLQEKENREHYSTEFSPLREINITLTGLENEGNKEHLTVNYKEFTWPTDTNEWATTYSTQLTQIYGCLKSSGSFTVVGNASWAMIIYGYTEKPSENHQKLLKELANGLLPSVAVLMVTGDRLDHLQDTLKGKPRQPNSFLKFPESPSWIDAVAKPFMTAIDRVEESLSDIASAREPLRIMKQIWDELDEKFRLVYPAIIGMDGLLHPEIEIAFGKQNLDSHHYPILSCIDAVIRGKTGSDEDKASALRRKLGILNGIYKDLLLWESQNFTFALNGKNLKIADFRVVELHSNQYALCDETSLLDPTFVEKWQPLIKGLIQVADIRRDKVSLYLLLCLLNSALKGESFCVQVQVSGNNSKNLTLGGESNEVVIRHLPEIYNELKQSLQGKDWEIDLGRKQSALMVVQSLCRLAKAVRDERNKRGELAPCCLLVQLNDSDNDKWVSLSVVSSGDAHSIAGVPNKLTGNSDGGDFSPAVRALCEIVEQEYCAFQRLAADMECTHNGELPDDIVLQQVGKDISAQIESGNKQLGVKSQLFGFSYKNFGRVVTLQLHAIPES